MANYNKRLVKIHALQGKVKALTEELEGLKKELKQDMLADNLETVSGGGFTASLSKYTRQVLDNQALKAAEPELYSKYSKPQETLRLNIK